METPEQKQQTEIFDIKRQPIEVLSEKNVEEIQKRFLVQLGENSWTIPEVMKNYGILQDRNRQRIIEMSSKALKYFPYFTKNIELGVDTTGRTLYESQKSEINKKNLFLLKIEKVFVIDGLYYFYTSDGQILTANKTDFDNYGIKATSLKFYGEDSGSVWGKVQSTIEIEGLTAVANGKGFINFSKETKHVTSLPGDKVFQIEEGRIIISNDGELNKYQMSSNGSDKLLESFSVPYKEISQMVVDYNRNFLFIVEETDEGPVLHIVLYDSFINKHELEPVYSIKNVKKICGLGKDNGMICLMNDNSLQYYRNTFSKFKTHFFKDSEDRPGGKLIYPKDKEVTTIVDSGKSKLLESLENGGISIEIDGDEIVDDNSKMDKDLKEKIWGLSVKIGEDQYTLKQLFEEANDEKAITKVYEIFGKIKRNPELSRVGGIIRDIEKAIVDKKNKIVLDSIFSELGEIGEKLGEASDLATLITIKDKLKEIQKKRKNIQAGIIAEDKELKDLLEVVNQKIADFKEAHKEEIEEEIESNLEKMKELLDDIENMIDISSVVYTTPLYKEIEYMISCLDVAGQTKYKKLLRDLIVNRQKEIKEISNQAKKEELEIIAAKKKEIEENIEQIKEILEEIEDIDVILQYKENDALVQRTKDLLSELPSSDAQLLDLKLDKLFGERIFSLRVQGEESKGVIQNLDTYGIDTILYYDETGSEQVEWKIEGKERSDGKISLVAKLMNGETHEYDKSLYLKDYEKYADVFMKDLKVKFDMDEGEFGEYSRVLASWKKSGKKELQELIKKRQKETDLKKKEELKKEVEEKKYYYRNARYTESLMNRLIKQQKLNPRSKVPPFDPDYIVLDEEKQILKELSTRLVDQKHNSGIEILEGGPGLGKTVMCEFLANVTNREIIRVQCSKMDPSDMFFAPTLKKGETSREPADWIKLMQKPGTIILFDEIDKLNDQCFERLHSLFDRGRSVYDPQLGKIKANPDCLFLGTRNSYDRLSNPIISRGRILQINYPSELNEAYKISKYADSSILKKLSFEEFQMLYEKYVIRSEGAPNNTHERKVYNLIINIKHLLSVFTTLRKQYDSDEPFKYELSYRDARQIFVDYNSSGDFKKSMIDVLVPKARAADVDPEDKKIQEDMVRGAIDAEL